MASPYLDVGQWLSLVSGYRSKTKLPKTVSGKIKEFLTSAKDDIRDIIETSTPIMFVLDMSAYTSSIQDFVNGLKSGDSTYTRFIKELEVDGEAIRPEDPRFLQELNRRMMSWKMPEGLKTKDSIVKVMATKTSTLETFSNITEKVLNDLNSKVEKILFDGSGDINIQQRQKARKTTVAAGRLLRIEFNKLTPCRLLKPETIVSNYNPNTQEIIIGVNFSSVRDRLNTYINAEVKKSFDSIKVTLSEKDDKNLGLKKFAIGELVVFGHTGGKTVDKGIAELIGINTPWTQQLMLLAAQKGKTGEAFSLLDGFAKDSGQVDLSVQFNKEVGPKVGVLLKGQLSIVVPITSKLNKDILEKETSAAANLVESIFGRGSTYRKVRSSLIDKILNPDNLLKLITGLRFSPTVVESIEDIIVQTLKSGKSRSVSAKSKKEVFSIIKDESVKIQKLSAVKKYSVPKVKNKPKTAVVTKAPPSPIDLTTLINSRLRDTIKSNMGTGDSRDVLNYRTGRFAESVVVERTSTSRQGMITAFYSYMKNPYAVFSAGGYQQFPRSRDPKLLIAKSIREIAQSIVSNQIRSVNV